MARRRTARARPRHPTALQPTALQAPVPGPLAALVARAKDAVADLELRGVEIDAAVADDVGDSLILAQVSCGVAARMAVLLRALDR